MQSYLVNRQANTQIKISLIIKQIHYSNEHKSTLFLSLSFFFRAANRHLYYIFFLVYEYVYSLYLVYNTAIVKNEMKYLIKLSFLKLLSNIKLYGRKWTLKFMRLKSYLLVDYSMASHCDFALYPEAVVSSLMSSNLILFLPSSNRVCLATADFLGWSDLQWSFCTFIPIYFPTQF